LILRLANDRAPESRYIESGIFRLYVQTWESSHRENIEIEWENLVKMPYCARLPSHFLQNWPRLIVFPIISIYSGYIQSSQSKLNPGFLTILFSKIISFLTILEYISEMNMTSISIYPVSCLNKGTDRWLSIYLMTFHGLDWFLYCSQIWINMLSLSNCHEVLSMGTAWQFY
jgi:hypothetical protein